MKPIETLLNMRFFRFAFVGAIGFVIDESVLTILIWNGQNKFIARIISILVAMTFTWLGNRFLTFRQHAATGLVPVMREAMRFFGTNSVGALISYSVYAGLIRFADTPFDNPNLAVFISVLAALTWNFTVSKHFVFGAGKS